ncbi:MAG: sugar phosphate isomerase/epimerase [Cytophagales bacterium]|nr:sugar phosphate isomerase/epimerase [Armatimonadota bacterium]
MRLGIGSFSFPWAIGIPGFPALPQPMNAFDLLEAAARLKVSAVQYVDNLPLTALSPGDLRHLLERARSAGIAIEVGMRGTRADGQDGLRAHLALARRVGSPFVRVMFDRYEDGDTPTADEIIARIGPLVPEGEAAGVALALENFDRFPARTLLRIVESLGGPDRGVGVCLDTVNNLGALEGPDEVAWVLAPYALNLHVKDVVIQRKPHRLGFEVEGRPAGAGMVDIPHILTQIPGAASVTLELWTAPAATIEATVRKEAEGVEASVAYLKPLVAARSREVKRN